jgi:hypothetical protein
MKIIGRISKKGNEYFQTAFNKEGEDHGEWVPVFIKKELDGKLNYTSVENKVDKRGVVYKLYDVEDKHCWIIEKPDGTGVEKVVITK